MEELGTVELMKRARRSSIQPDPEVLSVASDLQALHPHMVEDGIAEPATMDFLARVCYGNYLDTPEERALGVRVGEHLLARASAELLSIKLLELGVEKSVEEILCTRFCPGPTNPLELSPGALALYAQMKMEADIRLLGIHAV